VKALVFAAIVSIFVLVNSARGGDSGTHEAILVQALLTNAAGECSATLMAPAIKADCDQQLPGFKETLTKLGILKSTSFQGMRTLRSGPAEVYKVTFEHGDMTWIINTQEDGRIRVLWAPNEPTWNMGSFTR
jgi:hypothetical protein